MKRKLVLLTTLLAAVTFQAQAEDAEESKKSRDYFGVSYMEVQSKQNTGPSYTPTGFLVRLGHEFSDDLALEFQSGASQPENNFQFNRFNAIYLRGSMPYERLRLHASMGFARTSVKNSGVSDDSDGFSYGVGAQFATGKSFDVLVEWFSYATRSTYSVDAINIGFVKTF